MPLIQCKNIHDERIIGKIRKINRCLKDDKKIVKFEGFRELFGELSLKQNLMFCSI